MRIFFAAASGHTTQRADGKYTSKLAGAGREYDNLREYSPDRGVISVMEASLPTTCPTLLARLRRDPSNEAAWDEFVEHYGRHIYRWCRHWRLQDADAEDVTQEILLKLARKLRDFVYDPESSFRGWLKTVAHHTWLDFIDGQRHARAAANDHIRELLQSMEAREDLIQKLEEAFDYELLEAAKVQVRLRVAPHTWEAFQLVALEGRPAAEVAAKVHMQVAMVYVAKSKVQKMLQEEIRKLEADA
jgi:RNA polymerase sigma-70 factor (ECF subfamily)